MLIQIHRYEFEISTPYKDGQTISAAEAKILNIQRSERIRNNAGKYLHSIVKDLDPEKLISDEALEKFRAKVKELDETFEFRTKEITKPKSGTLDGEIRAVAEEKTRDAMRAQGRQDDGELDEEIFLGFLISPEVSAEAKVRIEAKRNLGDEERGHSRFPFGSQVTAPTFGGSTI